MVLLLNRALISNAAKTFYRFETSLRSIAIKARDLWAYDSRNWPAPDLRLTKAILKMLNLIVNKYQYYIFIKAVSYFILLCVDVEGLCFSKILNSEVPLFIVLPIYFNQTVYRVWNKYDRGKPLFSAHNFEKYRPCERSLTRNGCSHQKLWAKRSSLTTFGSACECERSCERARIPSNNKYTTWPHRTDKYGTTTESKNNKQNVHKL